MSHPIVSTVALVAAVTNGIGLAQVLPGASGLSVVLNGSLVTAGVAVMDAPRKIVIASGGNDSGITFTVTGTRGSWWANTAVTEVVTGSNGGNATTTQDFLTVTSIVASGAAAGNVTVGTSATGSGPWVVWDKYAQSFNVSAVGYVTAGAPTWTLQYTYDDVFGLWLPDGVLFPRALDYMPLSNQAGTADGALSSAGVKATRLTVTGVGTVQMTQQQQGS